MQIATGRRTRTAALRKRIPASAPPLTYAHSHSTDLRAARSRANSLLSSSWMAAELRAALPVPASGSRRAPFCGIIAGGPGRWRLPRSWGAGSANGECGTCSPGMLLCADGQDAMGRPICNWKSPSNYWWADISAAGRVHITTGGNSLVIRTF